MKRTQLIFPLLFLIALAGSAFSRQKQSAKKDFDVAYYYDYNWGTCNTVDISDRDCTVDNVGYPCTDFVPGLGTLDMYVNGISTVCWQPFYTYQPY